MTWTNLGPGLPKSVYQLEDTTRSDSRDLRALQLQVKILQEKSIDTENRLRRNNIRVLGLPERAEGARPAEFAETFLISLLGLPAMPPTLLVESPPNPSDSWEATATFPALTAQLQGQEQDFGGGKGVAGPPFQ